VSEPTVVAVIGGLVGLVREHLPSADPRWSFVEASDAETAAAALPEAEVVLTAGGARAWLEASWGRARRLRWIHSASDGVDGLLFPALVDSQVVVTNARGVFDEPIAEWAIAAYLGFRTGFHRSVRDTVAGVWEDDRSRLPVAGSTLVVLGPGPIGRATARRAHDLGIHVTAIGRAPRDDDVFGRVSGPVGLHAALATADVVLDALPLTADTARYVDAAAFAAMKPGAIFLNVGRGGTVDEEALIAAVASGHLGGAALDVVTVEPLPADSPLWTFPNVVISPHVCGDVEGWVGQVVGQFVDNLERDARGEPLRNRVDTRAGFGVGDLP
jgi:phosphoglycerate dehydrogenase-like enzyme